MKKDKEWLKEQLVEIKERNLSGDNIEGAVTINLVLKLIDELDKTEVEQSDKKIRELESYNNDLIRDNNQLRDELDNQEVLSLDWLEENEQSIDYRSTVTGQFVESNKLQSLLVPKQEEMKVPKMWHDVIVQNKEDGHSLRWVLNYIDNLNVNDVDSFARAWIAYPNIEVEEEQKYYVLDSEDIPLLERANNQTYKTTTALSLHEDGRVLSKFELTEQEIRDYDDRFWVFAEPVKEVEFRLSL